MSQWQNHIERILASWVDELEVPIYREREVMGFAQDDTGVDVELSDGTSLRAEYLVGCEHALGQQPVGHRNPAKPFGQLTQFLIHQRVWRFDPCPRRNPRNRRQTESSW